MLYACKRLHLIYLADTCHNEKARRLLLQRVIDPQMTTRNCHFTKRIASNWIIALIQHEKKNVRLVQPSKIMKDEERKIEQQKRKQKREKKKAEAAHQARFELCLFLVVVGAWALLIFDCTRSRRGFTLSLLDTIIKRAMFQSAYLFKEAWLSRWCHDFEPLYSEIPLCYLLESNNFIELADFLLLSLL